MAFWARITMLTRFQYFSGIFRITEGHTYGHMAYRGRYLPFARGRPFRGEVSASTPQSTSGVSSTTPPSTSGVPRTTPASTSGVSRTTPASTSGVPRTMPASTSGVPRTTPPSTSGVPRIRSPSTSGVPRIRSPNTSGVSRTTPPNTDGVSRGPSWNNRANSGPRARRGGGGRVLVTSAPRRRSHRDVEIYEVSDSE